MVVKVRSAAAGGIDEIAAFTAEVDRQHSLRDLSACLSAAIVPHGLTTFALGRLLDGSATAEIYISTWPRAWIEHYAASGFIAIDPVPAEARLTPDPFTFDEMIHRRALADHPVIRSGFEFGFRQGFVVPVHGQGAFVGLVAMAGPRLRLSPAERPILTAKARLCFAAARRMFEARRPTPILSPREREALALVSQGLDDAAIGAAMGVTKASAHIYVERAKRRLGATTRAQAIAIATADGAL